MVFRNNKAYLPVAFEEPSSTVWSQVPPSSRLWREKLKNKKIEKRRPTTVVTGAGGAPGDKYEVGATKKRKNEEKRLNYAYFDAQLRKNAL